VDAIRFDWTPAEDAAATGARLARGIGRCVREQGGAPPAGPRCGVVHLRRRRRLRPADRAGGARRALPLFAPLYLYVSRSALDELRVRSLARFAVVEYGQLILTVRTIVPADPRAVERSARELPPAPIPEG